MSPLSIAPGSQSALGRASSPVCPVGATLHSGGTIWLRAVLSPGFFVLNGTSSHEWRGVLSSFHRYFQQRMRKQYLPQKRKPLWSSFAAFSLFSCSCCSSLFLGFNGISYLSWSLPALLFFFLHDDTKEAYLLPFLTVLHASLVTSTMKFGVSHVSIRAIVSRIAE